MRSRLRPAGCPGAAGVHSADRRERVRRLPERDGTPADGNRRAMTALVTGIGVASPIGLGVEEYWQGTLSGALGIAPITRFDPAKYRVRLAGEVRGFEPEEHLPARLLLRKGSRLAVTGGIDSSLCPWAWVAHLVAGSLSERDDPKRAYLPFDEGACGHVPGEGGAMLVLETAESAAERAVARPYGEIAGYAATFDSRREGRAVGLGRAAALALADARMSAADIDVVFADAAGLPELDETEAGVIAGIFGPDAVPVTAPKTMTGRLYAGGGSLDLAAALLSILHNVIPPTANVHDVPRKYRIDLVRGEPRSTPVRAALVLSRGRGGFNSAAVAREFTFDG